jgi:hypothetical protein
MARKVKGYRAYADVPLARVGIAFGVYIAVRVPDPAA